MIKRVVVMFIAFAMSGGLALAQQKGEKKEKDADKKKVEAIDKKDGKDATKVEEAIKEIYKRLDIGVKIYMDWIMQWGHKDPSAFNRVTNYQPDPGKIRFITGTGITLPQQIAAYMATPPSGEFKSKNNNAFRIQRAYLDIKFKMTDILSLRLTSDADAAVTPQASAGDANSAFHLFLKFAYIEAKKDFGPVMLSAAGGLIEAPNVGQMDKISDMRWIMPNYLNQSKNIIGQSIDTSADLGVRASIGIMKYATLTAAFTNGGGYNKDESNSYKAVTYQAMINPIKELYLLGFGRNEITDKYDWTGKKAKKEYYGYGIAYANPMIKVGFNHIFPYVTTVGVASDFNSAWVLSTSTKFYVYPKLRRGYMILDAFLNFNLGAVVEEAPLLVLGRFAYGLQRKTYQKMIADTECGKERVSFLYMLGVGWQFNKYFRILLGGEIQQYRVHKNKFLRYAETRGTDFYSPISSVNYYVGSHQPHDTKRVYVKAEVTF